MLAFSYFLTTITQCAQKTQHKNNNNNICAFNHVIFNFPLISYIFLTNYLLTAKELLRIGDEACAKESPILVNLVGLVDNAYRLFPKTAHSAMTLISLVVARSPSAALSRLDPIVLIDTFKGVYIRSYMII